MQKQQSQHTHRRTAEVGNPEFHGKPAKQDSQPGHQSMMQPTPVTIAEGYRGAGKLHNRSALITGGDSGIGRAVAVHFAREGADIAFMYFDEHEDAAETQRLVEAEGRRCIAIAGDARDADHCRTAVDRVVREFGAIDVLVNNLGMQCPQDELADIGVEQLTRTFETNVYPLFFITSEALTHMSSGASIINTSSVTAFRGHKKLIDYSATKGAIESMTYSLAQNLAKRGIRVNGVAPGPIWTPLIVSTFDSESIEHFGESTLLGRAGQPAELGPAYVYLASDDSSFMTGQFLHVNGGSHLGG